MIFKLLKDIVGKDLSKFSMPVFVNEPLSILQKSAEFMFFSNFMTQAGKEDDSCKRMVYMTLA